jgi:hypothetical protein
MKSKMVTKMNVGFKKAFKITKWMLVCIVISPLLPAIGLTHLIAALEN